MTKRKEPAPPPSDRVSGDELFVPAPHALVTDQRVSHAAFRLWCVLHRLWFVREAPTMDLLQELMGTWRTDKDGDETASERLWQSATRRSIERWLRELEAAGWLVWTRREDASRRYHLRTTARSASDAALLTTLRTLLTSGKATLQDVQELLNTAASSPLSEADDDATPPSHSSRTEAEEGEGVPASATSTSHHTTTLSHQGEETPPHTIPPSHGTIPRSHHTIPQSHDATWGSHGATSESHDAISPSHHGLAETTVTRQTAPAYRETPSKERKEEIPPPPEQPGAIGNGGGEGPTDTERFLLRQSFSARAAGEFRHLPLALVQADLERRKTQGQGPGAMVVAWRIDPPVAEAAQPVVLADTSSSATQAKAQALALAPPGVTELDIQYLALDLEEGVVPAVALTNFARRRAAVEASQQGDDAYAHR